MKADDGHFEYPRIVDFVVQITTNFMCHVTKYDASFILQTLREHHKWLPGHQRNLITLSQIKNSTVLFSNFMWLWMCNKCVKFHVKIPSGCYENGKKLKRILFFAAHCIPESISRSPYFSEILKIAILWHKPFQIRWKGAGCSKMQWWLRKLIMFASLVLRAICTGFFILF